MAGAVDIDFKLMRAAALLDSDPAAAIRAATEILALHPGHAAATLLLGTARRNRGDPQAGAAFAELEAAQPGSALIQLEIGRTRAAAGRAAEALAALRRAVEVEPNLAEAWQELAALYATRGDPTACDAAYAQFTRLVSVEQHLAEAAAAFAVQRLATAESLLRERLARAPQDAAAMRMLAAISFEREDYVEAERWLAECLKIAPGYSRARFDLARILQAQQKAEPMLPLLERLLTLEPGNWQYRSLQASAYSLLGQNDRAIAIFAALIAEFPDKESLRIACGNALRTAGRTAEAINAYRKAAELRAGCGEAWFCLANLKTFRFSDGDVEAMRAQAAREDIDDNDRLQFEFALGNALEDARDFAGSFAHYARGNALRRRAVRYDGVRHTRLVERTCALYTPAFFAARAGSGCLAPDPIFIVGLPRSGSTLLEQILASHSHVEGTRELPDIPGFALELGALGTAGEPPAYPDSVARLTRAQLEGLGRRYLQQTQPSRLRGRPHFVDKMPSNFCYAGLIHLILPNARIIDARRSPLACCFANFKQHFQAGVWFTYDLGDLGRYYRDYVRLMQHFDTVLPGRIHRVHYENLVADLEGEVRRLLDYCGLPFEEQCLRFHETRRVVQTASSEQVRRPLYAESVDQWRNYEPFLGELKEALGDVVQAYPPPCERVGQGA